MSDQAQNDANERQPVPGRIPINDPGYWRERAKRTFAEAEKTADRWLRIRLRGLALRYQCLAEWTESRSASPFWNAELIYGRKPRTIPSPHDERLVGGEKNTPPDGVAKAEGQRRRKP